jgi:excisionase family DNA binding protein
MNNVLECKRETIPTLHLKPILSFREATCYLDVSESFLYKMTSGARINYFKPNNGKIYFKREDLDNWMLSNEVKSINDLQNQVLNAKKKCRYEK